MYRQLSAFWNVGLAVLFCTPSPAAVSSVRETGAAFEKWVETRQLISEIETEWAAERQLLDAEASLLKHQIKSLEDDISRLQNAATSADTERRELATKRGMLRQQQEGLDAVLAPLASQVGALTQRFPKPLLEKVVALRALTSHTNRDNHTATDQLVAILGILREADRFNRRPTLRKELQSVAQDQQVQVETLYWGLAFAFAGDRSGTIASFGFPTDAGWSFRPANEEAPAIRKLLDTAVGATKAVRFVPLSIELK